MPIDDVTVVIRWILALALGVAAAWLAYGRVGSLARSRATLLGALRALAVTIVAAILFGAPSAPPRPAAPLVAIDVSASSRRAVGDENSIVRAWRERLAAAVKADAPGADAFVIVGDSIRDISAADISALRSDDQGSRVRAAVDRAASLGRPLVLLTDGEVDDAEALAEAPAGSIVRVLANAPRTDGAIADMAVPTNATAGDTITVAATAAHFSAGHAVHRRGSDHRARDLIVRAGTRLTGREIAVAASCGYATIAVSQSPKIAVVATGDELVEVDAPVAPHQIRRSNDHALSAALTAAGYPHVSRFHLRDVRHEIEHLLWHIIAEFDVVLIAGGVSKGKFDYLPAELDRQGVNKIFQGVAQRPGKPFWFG